MKSSNQINSLEQKLEEIHCKIYLQMSELKEKINKGKRLFESEESFEKSKKIWSDKTEALQLAFNYSLGYIDLPTLNEELNKYPLYKHTDYREKSETEKLIVSLIDLKIKEIMKKPELLKQRWTNTINDTSLLFQNMDVMKLVFAKTQKYSQDYYSQRLVCKKLYLFFSECNAELSAHRLAECVWEAEFIHAKKIATSNPPLIFIQVPYTDINGNRKNASPLQIAFELLSSFHIDMFYELIKDDQNLLQQFNIQYDQQSDFYSIDKLCGDNGAYHNYAQNKSPDDYESRKIVGKEQACVPLHMLKEFCRARNHGNFDELPKTLENEKSLSKVPPARMRKISGIFHSHYYTRLEYSWHNLSPAILFELGKKFVLILEFNQYDVGDDTFDYGSLKVTKWEYVFFARASHYNRVDGESANLSTDRRLLQCIYDSAMNHFKGYKEKLGLQQSPAIGSIK